MADRVAHIRRLLRGVIKKQNLEFVSFDEGGMGGWFVEFDSTEFIVQAGRDRSGEIEYVSVGSKIRRKPRAQMRGPWSMGHLRGHLDRMADHYHFSSLESQCDWLTTQQTTIFDSAFLNSDELSDWAVDASRRMFGEPARKRRK